jgi:putative transposase
VFSKPVIRRCQQAQDPERYRQAARTAQAGHREADAAGLHAESALKAEAELQALARELDKTRPGAAASLRHGMAETLTVLRLGVPPTLASTLRSTNTIESMVEICREHSKNVKRWRDGTMALRGCAAGMTEAGKQFRRVNGHLHLPQLRVVLDACFTENVTVTCLDQDQKGA